MFVLKNIQTFFYTCNSSFAIAAFIMLLLYGLRRNRLLLCYACVAMLYLIFLFFIFVQHENRVGQISYCIEYLHIPLLLYLLWEGRKKVHFFLLQFSKEESAIFVIAMAVGFFTILMCAFSNSKYIYPCNADGFIGNYYFNADTERCTSIVLSNSLQAINHTMYRFILNLFLLPCVILFHVLGHSNWLLGGYYIIILQVFWNSISALLIYRIIMLETCNKKISLCATFLFIISGAFLFTVMVPETYCLTVCCILLALYLLQKDFLIAEAFVVLAIGMNPFSGIIYIPFLIKKIRKYLDRHHGIFFCFGTLIFIVLMFSFGRSYFWQSVQTINYWKIEADLPKKICDLWVSVFSSGFLGPHMVLIGPYFMQKIYWTFSDACLLVVVCIAILPLCRMKKSLLIYSTIILVLGGIILHGLIGFGENIGFLYSPLYVPAVIILISYGVSGYKKCQISRCVFTAMLLLVSICSLRWLIAMGSELRNTNFPITKWHNPEREFSIENVSFHFENKVLSTDSYILLEGVDSIQISEEENKIVGTTRNGLIYIITIHDKQYELECIS